MKTFTYTFVLFIVASVLVASCKKENSMQIIKLNTADSGKMVTAVMGQQVSLTLGNPGDGGYNFDAPQYDAAVLKLVSHIHTNPVNTQVAGDFGTDTWQFSPVKSGMSTLKVTATRPWTGGGTVAVFKSTVIVE